MKIPPRKFSNGLRILCALVLLTAPFFNLAFQKQDAQAAGLQARSLLLEANGTNGGSAPGVAVNHNFSFQLGSSYNLGSVRIEYCTTAATTTLEPYCTEPAGIDTTGAGFANISGPTFDDFTVETTDPGTPDTVTLSPDPNAVLLDRDTSGAIAVTSATVINVRLTTIVNPTAANQTFFARISTFTSTDGSGTAQDQGTVAASTANPIILTGTMPESLVFCTGATVGVSSGDATINNDGSVPDCSTATSGSISFDQLFDPLSTATATSMMAASTNAANGYVITVNGNTLQNGSFSINAMATAGPSLTSNSQFGMNLKDNATPDVGREIDDLGNGTNLRGQAKGDYAVADSFAFVSGATVAASDNATPGPTDAQIYTASYIVNVPGSQAPGTYQTTLTYICTANF